jgi:hypothetical protein
MERCLPQGNNLGLIIVNEQKISEEVSYGLLKESKLNYA